MEQIIPSTPLYLHPTFKLAVRPDGEAFRIGKNGLNRPKIWNTGKNGKPYPAINVQRWDDSWTASTLARLVRECIEAVKYPREIHAHHLEGREKADPSYDGTAPLDEVTHGRESQQRQTKDEK
jgi:hypothetical protein